MASERRNDLKAFHDFVGEQLANGGASLTPAETLELWRFSTRAMRSKRRR